MLKLLSAYNKFFEHKSVVEAGCSLMSNLCYSNKESKELLYSYGIADVLLKFANAHMSKPEVSTYKQILRSMGNMSLHKQCAEKLIDGHICLIIIELIEKFNILIFRDSEKLKLLKVAVDTVSNLATHKYKLMQMHDENLTNCIITIL